MAMSEKRRLKRRQVVGAIERNKKFFPLQTLPAGLIAPSKTILN